MAKCREDCVQFNICSDSLGFFFWFFFSFSAIIKPVEFFLFLLWSLGQTITASLNPTMSLNNTDEGRCLSPVASKLIVWVNYVVKGGKCCLYDVEFRVDVL